MSKGTIYAKNADFLQRNADISKINRVLVLKGIFFETTSRCVLTYQTQVSSIILTSFGQGVILPLSPSQNGPLKSPPRLGLMDRTRSLYSGHKGKSKHLYVLKKSAGITSSISLSEIDYVAVDGFGMSHLLQQTEKITVADLVNAVCLWVDDKKKFC